MDVTLKAVTGRKFSWRSLVREIWEGFLVPSVQEAKLLVKIAFWIRKWVGKNAL